MVINCTIVAAFISSHCARLHGRHCTHLMCLQAAVGSLRFRVFDLRQIHLELQIHLSLLRNKIKPQG